MSVNAHAWAGDLLAALTATPTDANVSFLGSWAMGENTKARFNPLATTRSAFNHSTMCGPGESNFNSVAVKNFASYDDGVRATAATIRNGFYPHVLASLVAGNAPSGGDASHELDIWG